ncbi:MAG TPA: hypothetical protein VF796_02810 [Humisphaera sp.]
MTDRRPFPNAPLSRLALAGVAALGLAAAAGGCQPADPYAVRPGQPADDIRREVIEVRPEWRAFANENYRGVLLADLNAARDVRFNEPLTYAASRNPATGDVELSVAGTLDANTVTADRFRRPFTVLWRQSGGGWTLLTSRIDRGGPVPVPPRIPPTPGPIRTSPTTGPSTIADPTAMPLPSNNPSGVPTAPGGGAVTPDTLRPGAPQ